MGYTGNGKTYCVECGRTLVNPINVMQRIVGGSEAFKSSWPYHVLIVQSFRGKYRIKDSFYSINYSWSCGGTIINQKTVLTAAHCVHDKSFDYQDGDDYYNLSIEWNEWYPNLESTFSVYAGAHDTRYLNHTKRLRVKRIIKVIIY